jgi:A/G-specific adenine glycosylase
VRHTTVAIIRDGAGALLLEARPPVGIWGGLMSLPEFDAGASDADLACAIADRYALDVALGERLPAVHHDFSHFRLVMHPRLATVQRALTAAASGGRLVEPAALDNTALPAPIRRLLEPIEALVD